MHVQWPNQFERYSADAIVQARLPEVDLRAVGTTTDSEFVRATVDGDDIVEIATAGGYGCVIRYRECLTVACLQ